MYSFSRATNLGAAAFFSLWLLVGKDTFLSLFYAIILEAFESKYDAAATSEAFIACRTTFNKDPLNYCKCPECNNYLNIHRTTIMHASIFSQNSQTLAYSCKHLQFFTCNELFIGLTSSFGVVCADKGQQKKQSRFKKMVKSSMSFMTGAGSGTQLDQVASNDPLIGSAQHSNVEDIRRTDTTDTSTTAPHSAMRRTNTSRLGGGPGPVAEAREQRRFSPQGANSSSRAGAPHTGSFDSPFAEESQLDSRENTGSRWGLSQAGPVAEGREEGGEEPLLLGAGDSSSGERYRTEGTGKGHQAGGGPKVVFPMEGLSPTTPKRSLLEGLSPMERFMIDSQAEAGGPESAAGSEVLSLADWSKVVNGEKIEQPAVPKLPRILSLHESDAADELDLPRGMLMGKHVQKVI